MKRLLLQLSACAALFAGAAPLFAQEEPTEPFDPSKVALWGANKNGSMTSNEANLFDPYIWCRYRVSGDNTWYDIPEDERILPDFLNTNVKFDHVWLDPITKADVEAAGLWQTGWKPEGEGFSPVDPEKTYDGFVVKQWSGLYNTKVTITGPDMVMTFINGLSADGYNAEFNVENGATVNIVNTGAYIAAENLILNFRGTEDARVSFNGKVGKFGVANWSYVDWDQLGLNNVEVGQNANVAMDHVNWKNSTGNFTIQAVTLKTVDGERVIDKNAGVFSLADSSWTKTHGNITMNVFNGSSIEDITSGYYYKGGGSLSITNTDLVWGLQYEDDTGAVKYNEVNVDANGGTISITGSLDKSTGNLDWISGNMNVRNDAKVIVDNINIEQKRGSINIDCFTGGVYDPSMGEFNAVLEIKDNVTWNASGGIGFGHAQMTDGSGKLLFSGENSTLKLGAGIGVNISDRTGGDFSIVMQGKNNSLEATGDINLDGYKYDNGLGVTVDGGSVGIVVEGEGNTFKSVKRIHLGRNDIGGSDGARDVVFLSGKAYMHVSGTNAENKNYILLGNDSNAGINLGLDNNSYFDEDPDYHYETELIFGGNTVVRNISGEAAIGSIAVGSSNGDVIDGKTQDEYGDPNTSGLATFKIMGDNNDIWATNLYVLSRNYLYGEAYGVMDISGSNNKLLINNDISVMSAKAVHGGEATFTYGGSNNSVQTKNFKVGNTTNDNVYLKGEDGKELRDENGQWILDTENSYQSDGGKGTFVMNATNSTLTVTGDMRIHSEDADRVSTIQGGEGHATFGGSGNTVTIGGQAQVNNGNHTAAGTGSLAFTGSDNVFSIAKNLSIASNWGMSGGEAHVTYDGSGNKLSVGGDLLVGNMGNGNFYKMVQDESGNWVRAKDEDGKDIVVESYRSTGGLGTFVMGGSNNELTVTGQFKVNSAGDIDGGEGYATFGGTNNKVTITGDARVGNHDRSTGGIGELTFSGKGNTITFGTLMIGGGTEYKGGHGKLIFSGGGNTVNVTKNFQGWSDSVKDLNNMVGAIMEWQVDMDGVTTLNVAGNFAYDGYLIVDFSKVVGPVQNQEYVLITGDTATEWALDESLVQKILRDESDIVSIVKEDLEDGSWALKAYYTSTVPEPAAFAALMGLAALLFAARRRKFDASKN